VKLDLAAFEETGDRLFAVRRVVAAMGAAQLRLDEVEVYAERAPERAGAGVRLQVLAVSAPPDRLSRDDADTRRKRSWLSE